MTIGLVLGAAMLAAWVDARLGEARPHTPTQVLIHGGLSAVGLFSSVGLLSLVYGIPEGPFMVAVLTVFLPALVYALLAGLWMLRALSGLTGLAGR